MAQFMLLLHGKPGAFQNLTPSEMQEVIAQYRGWGEKLASEGKLESGHKLTDDGGRHLSKRGGEVLVTDGPFIEAKEVLGGYYLVEAADMDAAVEIAETCPHLGYAGRIEVREIDRME